MILVTGGAGYIGSHTCVELIKHGYEILVLDNFSNSSAKVFDRLKKITGQDIPYVDVDIRDEVGLETVFSKYNIRL